MNTRKRNFDKDAASWDENPVRLKLAADVADAIAKQVALSSQMEVIDFGCGTGLLALRLQPLVRSIVGVDSSQGMLDVFQSKIARSKPGNVRGARVDLDHGAALEGSFDLIVSSMTLHHIQDVQSLLDRLFRITKPGGHLCIADLDLEQERFHDDNTGVFHFGFDRAALRRNFEAAGFVEVRDGTAAAVAKPSRDGTTGRFPVFLMTGRKSG